MSTNPTSPSSLPVEEESRYPSVGVRTVVSLALFIHLFALGVALMANRPVLSSPLERQLKTVPFLSQYLQLLWMDLSYDYHQTNGMVPDDNGQRMTISPAMDFDHRLEIELTTENGTETVVIPQAKFPRQRYVREQRLADEVIRRVGDQNNEARMPAAITRYWMEKTGASKALFRCIEQMPVAPEVLRQRTDDLGSQDPNDERYFSVVFEGTAQLRKGNFVFSKVESTRDAAPTAVDAPQ